MRNSKALRFTDFSGGLNTYDSPTTIAINQSLDLDNIILLPKSGFKKRNGNSVFNSSAMASGAQVQGLGYFRKITGSDWLMAIAGNKIYSSASLTGTMSDITGSVTITGGNNNIWTYAQMNDLTIFVGGALSTDVPIKWSGSGNAAVLGGSPTPSEFCVLAANRLFLGNNVANPSRIYWSVLGDPEDWSGVGSGSQDISTNDGDYLVGGATLNANHMLLFKQNSIHDMVLTASPFPVFPLFKGVGAASKRGIVEVDGALYFITPQPRMKATDGTRVEDFPDTINPLWDSLNPNRLKYIQGIYDRRRRLILWFCSNSSSSTNDICIAWDLNRKCWLQFTTGHKMNAAATMSDRTIYAGAYNGKVYKLDDPVTTDDASESSTAVDAHWRSGWIDEEAMILSKGAIYADLNFSTQESGTFIFSYGFDFNQDSKNESVSMAGGGSLYDIATYDSVDVYGGLPDKTRLVFMKGKGKFFQYQLRNANSGESFSFNRMEIPIKGFAPTAAK